MIPNEICRNRKSLLEKVLQEISLEILPKFIMKITKEQQTELANRAKIIDLASPEYLRKKTNDNYKFIVKKILGLDVGKTVMTNGVDMAQLIVESGLYSAISWAYKDSVWNTNEIDETEMGKYIDSLIATGVAWWKVVSSDGKSKEIVAVQSSSFFESLVSNSKIYTEFKIYKNDRSTYVFTRSFFVGYNELKLYVTNSTDLSDAKEVPLTTISETTDFEPIEQTGMNIPAFQITKKSDRIFESVKTLIDSIDRRMTEIEIEFHKHLDAKTLYKNIDINQDAVDIASGKILKEKMGNEFFCSNPDASIEYVVNSNPMIEKAMEFIDRDIRRISAISKVPLDYLGVSSSDGAIGAESRNAKNAIFFAKVTNIRDTIAKVYNDLIGTTLNFWPIIGYADNQDTWTKWNDSWTKTE